MVRTILIVDDNLMELAVLSNMLKPEYNVISAESAEVMFSVLRAKAKSISAILLDLMMPGMDGFEALEKMRETELYRQIPVIVTTSLTDTESQVKALSLGAAGYAFKPYNKELLQHMLENTINLREKSALSNTLHMDMLTGLMSRSFFFEQASELIKSKPEGYYILACFDIENFKVINDQYGVEAGDTVLRLAAKEISASMASVGGIACRDAADKFGLLFPAKYKDDGIILKLHQNLVSSTVTSRSIKIRVGRYLVDDKSLPVSSMYDRATLAEESIKGLYDSYVAYYDDSMRIKLLQEQQIVNDMGSALAVGEFEPWFQPQYNHATGALIGAEALVRWRRNGEIVPPGSFIPVFERNGFIYEVDQFIWRQVCITLRRWLDEGPAPLPVSVNISRYDLFQPDFLSIISGLLKEYNLPDDLLRLEITESAFAESSKTIIHMVNELIELGFTVEIDDFGSGYSSLNTLKDVPASILKLDMKFFENTDNSQRGGNIVESVVRMAKWLGMAVIAEGVEDREQADYLKTIGCFYIQGYFYARPMPPEDYEKLLCGRTEPRLTHLQTLSTLDNNEFWDPKSMDTLIFNSYVGAACILEHTQWYIEMLRANDYYIKMLGSSTMDTGDALRLKWAEHMDDENRRKFGETVEKSIETKEVEFGEFEFTGLPGCPKKTVLRVGVRVIATAGERHLLYCLSDNITAQKKAEQEALNASERITAVMDSSHCGITAVVVHEDKSVEYLFVNNRFYEILGYTREQFEKEVSDPFGCILAEDRVGITAAALNLKEVGQTLTLRMRAVRRDGSIIWLRDDISLVKFANVPMPVQLSSFLDITDQVENEMKQLESSRQLEIIMSNVNGGVSAVYIHDGKPEFAIANDQYYSIIGYTREQFNSEIKSVFDLLVPEDRERVSAQVLAAYHDEKPFSTEYRCIRRDGKIINILCKTSIVRLLGIDAPVQLSVTNDVTDLRTTQQEKLATMDRLQTIMDVMNNGMAAVAFYDGHTEFLFANRQYYEMHGLERESIGRRDFGRVLTLVHPDDCARMREVFFTAARTRQTASAEYRIVRSNGAVVWTKVVINVTSLVGIDVPVLVMIFSDVTAEKQAGDQLRFLNSSAHDILAQPDSEQAIRDTLKKLLDFFCAGRSYVVELDAAKGVTSNTYEICAENVRPEIENLQNIPYTRSDFWYEAISNNKFLIIDNVDELDDVKSALRELLSLQSIHSLIIAPLRRDGELIGFVGVDNPTVAIDQVAQLTALSDYFSILLTRRDLNLRIEKDRHSLEQLLDNLPCGAALYEFDGKDIRAIHINKRYQEMVKRDVNFSLEGFRPVEYIHPDDRRVVFDEVTDAIAHDRDGSCDIRLKYGDEGYRSFHLAARIKRKKDGKYLLYVAYNRISDEEFSFKNALPFIFSTIMESSTDLAFAKDINFRYMCCSRTFATLLGLESEMDVIGKTDYELFSSDIADQFRRDDSALFATGKPQIDIQESIPSPDGTLHYTMTSKHLLRSTTGEIVGVYCIGRDVTETREAYAQLKILTDSIPGGIATFYCAPGDIRLTYFNDGLCSLSGYSRQEHSVPGFDVLELVFPEDHELLDNQIRILMKEETPFECVFRIRTKDGGYKWVNCRAVVVDHVRDALIVNAVLTDITGQQEEKERLRVSEELNRLAIEHSGNIITRFDVSKRTLTLPNSFNPIFVLPRVLNNVPQEQIALGRVSPDTADVYTELFESIVRGKPSGSATYKQNSTKGWRWLEVQFTTVFSSDGKPMSAVISFADITEQLEKEVVYNKWQQSLEERPADSYTLFRCNLSKGASFDSWEGKLLNVSFNDTKQTFDACTSEYVEQCVYEGDREKYLAFLDSDTMLASYYRSRRSASIEYRERTADGGTRWLSLTVDLVEYPNSKDVEAYLMYEDINEQKTAELLTQERAENDPLTGILNRSTFISRMEEILNTSKPGEKHALMMLDVDNFKHVNDTLGHGAGDQVLRDLTSQIRAILRADDLIGRLGGDEFFVFLKGISGHSAAMSKAEQICALKINAEGSDFAVTASIGIAVIPKDGRDFDTLYKKVDAALYRQKEHGKNGFRFAE